MGLHPHALTALRDPAAPPPRSPSARRERIPKRNQPNAPPANKESTLKLVVKAVLNAQVDSIAQEAQRLPVKSATGPRRGHRSVLSAKQDMLVQRWRRWLVLAGHIQMKVPSHAVLASLAMLAKEG